MPTTATPRIIASADTSAGFAIAVLEFGESRYGVARLNRASRYLLLSAHATEQDARDAANQEWRRDVAA